MQRWGKYRRVGQLFCRRLPAGEWLSLLSFPIGIKWLGGNDLWIACHALAIEATLVTRSTRAFRRIEGLVAEDWVGDHNV